MNVAAICGAALALFTQESSEYYAPRLPAMSLVCEEVAHEAVERGHDVGLILSLVWEESRFHSYSESGAGAIGPMQVLPRYWCPEGDREGCDLVAAGFHAFETFQARWPDVEETLCHYNSGNVCYPASRAYADRILRHHQLLQPVLEDLAGEGC